MSEKLQQILELAEAKERAGEWQDAEDLYAVAFQRGIDARSLDTIIDALRSRARLQRVQRRFEEAEETAQLSWEIAQQTGRTQQAARAVNMIAAIHYQQGNLGEAKRLYEQALEQARDVADDTLISFACQNLGIIANIEGNLREARALYLESISASIRAQNEASAMMAYNNLAMVCTDLGDFMESEVYFDRGIEIAERLGDATYLSLLFANRAETLIQVEEFDRALESLGQAEAIASRISYNSVLVDVARHRARIARLTGDLVAARECIDRALLLATDRKAELNRAETLEELAHLLWAQGRGSDANKALLDALEIFRSLGAVRDIARVEELLGQGSAGSDRPSMEALPHTGD